MNKAQLLDIGERAAWTLVQVSSAGGVVEILGLSPVYIAPLTLLFALIKNSLATKFGNGTASTLPASVEPRPPVPEVTSVPAA